MRKLSFIVLVFLSIVVFTGCDIIIRDNIVSVNSSNDIDIDTTAESEVTTTAPEVTTTSEVEDSTSTISETEVKNENSLVSSEKDLSDTLDSCNEHSVVRILLYGVIRVVVYVLFAIGFLLLVYLVLHLL